jgi:hypothetical protein
MHTRNKLISGVFLLALAAPCAAQDLQLSFKLGAGPFLLDPGQGRSRTNIHLGAELAMPVAKGQAFLGAEYRVFRNFSYDATQLGTGYGTNGTTGQITAYVLGTDGLPKADRAYDSVDIRRDNLDGVTFSLGYRFPFWTQGLSARGGINLSFLRSQQDVTGGINVVVNRNVTTPVVLGSEKFYTQFQKTSLAPGGFAGLRYDVTKVFFVETNLCFLGFKEINYLPFSYTGQPATTEMRKRFKSVLEFSVGINF